MKNTSKNSKFYHDDRLVSFHSAAVIVPVINALVKPASVIDLGCGSGSFLNQFKQHGVKTVLGLDGEWANLSLVKQYLSEDEFAIVDLENFSVNGRRFDLAINLEVAEHLSEASADKHVENLTQLSNVILFSAAIPFQGGQNHINEQWPSYWAEKFRKHDYLFMDILRPIFWGNHQVEYWYQQNIFLVVKKGYSPDLAVLDQYKDPYRIMDCVHPAIYNQKITTIQRIKNLDIKTAWYYLIRKFKQSFI